MGRTWLSVPKDWIASFGDIAKFMARVVGDIFNGRVLHFFGEALRQAGILILGSGLVIWGLAFILGLQCGIEGAYFNRSVGAPAYAGVFSAWCDLREIMPYAFGYMMSAKVGTGLVAGDRRDADLGRDRRARGDGHQLARVPLRHPAARGLDGSALHVHRRRGRRLLRELPGGGAADRRGQLRRLLPDLLDVPEPSRPVLQLDQGDGDGHRDRPRGVLLRL